MEPFSVKPLMKPILVFSLILITGIIYLVSGITDTLYLHQLSGITDTLYLHQLSGITYYSPLKLIAWPLSHRHNSFMLLYFHEHNSFALLPYFWVTLILSSKWFQTISPYCARGQYNNTEYYSQITLLSLM